MTTTPRRSHRRRASHRPTSWGGPGGPPTTSDAGPPLQLRGGDALLAAVPSLLGFVPARSLVLVSLRGSDGRRVGLCARLDLPRPGELPAVLDDLAAPLAAVVAEDGAVAAVLVVVDDRGPGEDHDPVVAALVAALAGWGVPVADTLGVDRFAAGGCWWHRGPRGTRSGGGVLSDPWSSPVAAAHVLAGRVLHADRGGLTAVVRPAAGAETPARRAAVSAAVAEARRHRDGSLGAPRRGLELVLAAVARCEDGVLPGEQELALVAGALDDVRVRDACVALAVTEHAAAAEQLWGHVTRSLPRPWRAEPACLLGASCYARGEGPSAGIALDAALESDPEHRLATMLRASLDAAMPPSEVRALAESALTAAERLGVVL